MQQVISSLTSLFHIEFLCSVHRVNARYQRRARLDFGTKLGMNSPF